MILSMWLLASLLVPLCYHVGASELPGMLCPCIDPNVFIANFSASLPNFDVENNCTVDTIGKEVVCLPRSYGANGCKAYDADVRSECKEGNNSNYKNRPSWCQSEWCYVDSNNCGVPHEMTQVYKDVGVAYSYETCGFLNDYTIDSLVNTLRNRPIRISYPGDSGSGFTLVTDPVTQEKKGSFPTFMNRIFNDLDLDVEIHQVSQSSQDRYPNSSFSACIHEVGLGQTDMCIGDFWPTAERSIISQFTVDLYQDNFYLVTFQKDSTTAGEFFSTAFRPFSGYVWLMIGVMTVFVAVTYVYIEGWTNETEFPESSASSKFFSSLYFKIISLLGGAPVHVPESPQGRVITTSFGFFILVIVASYTANLASYLVIQSVHGEFDSIETGVQMGVKFCGQEVLQSTIIAQYPQLTRIYVPKKSTLEALYAMDEGECGAAIIAKNELYYAQRGMGLSEDSDVTVHCNKVQVGDVLLSIGNALPVSPDLHGALSWAIVHYATMNPYYLDEEKAKNTFLDPFVCTANNGVSSGGELTLIDVGGTMVITICGVLLAVAWFMISRCNNKRGTDLENPAVPEGPIKSLEEKVAELVVLRLQQEMTNISSMLPPKLRSIPS